MHIYRTRTVSIMKPTSIFPQRNPVPFAYCEFVHAAFVSCYENVVVYFYSYI